MSVAAMTMKLKGKFVITVAILFFSVPSLFAEMSREYLEYGTERIRLDVYNPGFAKCPVVVLIHGASGIESADRALRYKQFATDLMNSGFIAINVYYFDTKGKQWAKTIIETINHSQKISNADMSRIGLVGYSLGGVIGLNVAASDKRVKALAMNAGFLPGGFSKTDAARLPLTLMISGDKDPAMETLTKLAGWFDELGKPYEKKIDQGIGHDNVPLDVFEEDWNTILRFLKNHL